MDGIGEIVCLAQGDTGSLVLLDVLWDSWAFYYFGR